MGQAENEQAAARLPLLNSGRIVLPRNDRLQGQIVGLERRTSAVGRDTISHPDRGHHDVANAVAGAAALSKFGHLSGSNDHFDRAEKGIRRPHLEAGDSPFRVIRVDLTVGRPLPVFPD